ncbi:division/cell wall cluster transcriptional repressor MraZ [Eubacterium sp.]|uniref:division/cell wall cluster transcriptional repressor MraZ n=1 Tax=Eubacterium sp. TaxID=142586 RepID=UPI004026D7D7
MDNYLYGYRVHKLDAKSRVAIPAHMRGRLGEEFVASLGLGDFVALYPQDQWEALLEKVQNSKLSGEKKKTLSMYLIASADKMSLDSQGRILLSDRLKNKVNLAGEKEAVVFGNMIHIENWNSALFDEEGTSIDKNEVIEIMDELNGIGI